MKKIIFDLDNTLLFLSDEWISSYQSFIDEYNFNMTPEELYKFIGSFERNNKNIIVTNEIFIKYINDNSKLNITDDILKDMLKSYVEIPLLYTKEVYDTLRYLSNKYELIAYTNWFTENQIDRLKKYNLDKFFSKVYGWDILPVKPSVIGLNSIIENNNKNDYIFIGDSISFDLELPNDLGIKTILLNTKNNKQNKYKEIHNIEELKTIL